MAMLHYQRVAADAVGTTARTREAIGSITLPNNATKLHGLIIQTESTGAMTTAEAFQPTVIIEGNELLNTSSMECMTSNGFGGGAGTNEGGRFDPGFYIPIQTNPGINPANVTIDFYADLLLDATSESYAQVWALSSNGAIDEAVFKNRGHGLAALNTKCRWWATAFDIDIGDAATELFANNVTVPSYVKLITGMLVSVSTDAVPTADEHFAGYLTLGGTIQDLYPMDCPLPFRGPSLGTAVDWTEHQWNYMYPLHIPHLSNTNDTLNVTANLAATTSANSVVGVTFFGI